MILGSFGKKIANILPYFTVVGCIIIAGYGFFQNNESSDKIFLGRIFLGLAIALTVLIVSVIIKFDMHFYDQNVGNIKYQSYIATIAPFILPSESKSAKMFQTELEDAIMEKFTDLKNMKEIKKLFPKQTFSFSIPIIKNLKKGDLLYAIDKLKNGEWEESTLCWDKYTRANKKAAENGATLRRIFVPTEQTPPEWKKKQIVKNHQEKKNGWYIPIDTFERILTLENRDLVDEGFLLVIKKTGERFVIFDHFKTREAVKGEYYTSANFDEKKIGDLKKIVEKLLKEEELKPLWDE